MSNVVERDSEIRSLSSVTTMSTTWVNDAVRWGTWQPGCSCRASVRWHRRDENPSLAPAEGAAGKDATAQESQSKSRCGCPALEAKLIESVVDWHKKGISMSIVEIRLEAQLHHSRRHMAGHVASWDAMICPFVTARLCPSACPMTTMPSCSTSSNSSWSWGRSTAMSWPSWALPTRRHWRSTCRTSVQWLRRAFQRFRSGRRDTRRAISRWCWRVLQMEGSWCHMLFSSAKRCRRNKISTEFTFTSIQKAGWIKRRLSTGVQSVCADADVSANTSI